MLVYCLSFTQMNANDPRVIAVREWLSKNYTIRENPGMGPQGLFYYFYQEEHGKH